MRPHIYSISPSPDVNPFSAAALKNAGSSLWFTTCTDETSGVKASRTEIVRPMRHVEPRSRVSRLPGTTASVRRLCLPGAHGRASSSQAVPEASGESVLRHDSFGAATLDGGAEFGCNRFDRRLYEPGIQLDSKLMGRLAGTRSWRSFDWMPCGGRVSLQGFGNLDEARSPIETGRQEDDEGQSYST
jgi:hypothetical protein